MKHNTDQIKDLMGEFDSIKMWGEDMPHRKPQYKTSYRKDIRTDDNFALYTVIIVMFFLILSMAVIMSQSIARVQGHLNEHILETVSEVEP